MSRALILIILTMCLTACDGPGCFTDSMSAGGGSTDKSNTVVFGNGGIDTAVGPSRWVPDSTQPGGMRLVNPNTSSTATTYGQWKATNVTVDDGDTVTFKTTGVVYLCPSFGIEPDQGQAAAEAAGELVQMTPAPGQQAIPFYRGKRFIVSATNENYTDTGLVVKRGDHLEIVLGKHGESYGTSNRARNDPGKPWFYNGDSASGKTIPGLFAYFNSGGSVASLQLNNPINIPMLGSYFGYFSNNSPYEGRLTFRIADASGEYGNNAGEYSVYVKRYGCAARDGSVGQNGFGNLKILITSKDPNRERFTDTVYTSQANGTISVAGGGMIWLLVNDNNYRDNSGTYDVEMNIQRAPRGGVVSGLVSGITNAIRTHTFSAAEKMYKELTYSTTSANVRDRHLGMIQTLLVIYVMFFAAKFMMGLVEMPQITFVRHVVKMGIIMALFSPTSWDFFSQNFFDLFMGGAAQLMNVMSGNQGTASNPWIFLDHAFALIFGPSMLYKIIGLLFYPPIGWAMLVLLVYGMLVFLKAIIHTIFNYVFASLVIGLLMVLAPIFITFSLFDQTKNLFQNWVNLAFRNILEPAFLVTGLIIIVQFVLISVSLVVGYSVCWKCAIPIKLVLPFLPPSHTLFCINWFMPWGQDPYGLSIASEALVRSLTAMLMMLIFIKILDNFNSFTKELMLWMVGYSSAAEISFAGSRGDAGEMAMGGLKNAALKPFGLDDDSRATRKGAFNRDMFQEKLAAMQGGGGTDRGGAGAGGATPDGAGGLGSAAAGALSSAGAPIAGGGSGEWKAGTRPGADSGGTQPAADTGAGGGADAPSTQGEDFSRASEGVEHKDVGTGKTISIGSQRAKNYEDALRQVSEEGKGEPKRDDTSRGGAGAGGAGAGAVDPTKSDDGPKKPGGDT